MFIFQSYYEDHLKNKNVLFYAGMSMVLSVTMFMAFLTPIPLTLLLINMPGKSGHKLIFLCAHILLAALSLSWGVFALLIVFLYFLFFYGPNSLENEFLPKNIEKFTSAILFICLLTAFYGVMLLFSFLTNISVPYSSIDENKLLPYCVFLFSWPMATLISRSLKKNEPPVLGIVRSGLIMVLLSSTFLFVLTLFLDTPPKEFLINKIEFWYHYLDKEKGAQISEKGMKNIHQMLDLLRNPSKLADEIIFSLPAYIFVSHFFMTWIAFFMLLRNKNLFAEKISEAGADMTDAASKCPASIPIPT